MKSARRVWHAPAFVLHQYPYRDTSRIVEAFTAEHGRISLFARGANGGKSALRGVLRPFQRLLLSWSGRGEAGNLDGAELDGAPVALPGAHLMSGFYLNELLLKLTERWDPHPEIFDAYAACIAALAGGADQEPALRRFEMRLLTSLGYGLELTRTEAGEAIRPDDYYRIAAAGAPRACVAETPGAVSGRSLYDLDAGRFDSTQSLKDAKRLLRAALDACLEGRALKSRDVMLALRQRETT